MKIKRLFFFLAFFGLVTISTVLAFRPGPDIIRECPSCKAHLAQQTTMSGNTFGAVSWTDGKMVAPMLPDRPWLVKCPGCKTLFWIDEAKELDEQVRGDNQTRWLPGMEPDLPSEADFLSMLSAGKLPIEKELYIRQRVWWAANDPIRMTGNATVTYSTAQEANLLALADILDENDPDRRITKAEIYRELGKFEACINLLARPIEDEYRMKVAAFIRKLAESKSRLLKEVIVE